MAKIDYTKVEKYLSIGTKKMFIQKIISLTEKEQLKEEEEQQKAKNKHMGKVLKSLRGDLERLSRKSDDMWTSLGMSRDKVIKFIENPGTLTKEDRALIGQLLTNIQEYKKTTGREIESEINEDLVQSEREKHIDKRINLKENWRPI